MQLLKYGNWNHVSSLVNSLYNKDGIYSNKRKKAIVPNFSRRQMYVNKMRAKQNLSIKKDIW